VPTLKQRRLALGISQEALARLADCSLNSLRSYENGLTPRVSPVLERIEQVLLDAEKQAA
jgi:transcriptional regulator with XRE-family HTH domain